MSLRVIAGRFKRRSLATPAGLATRPTTGRAREALFSILGAMDELNVLDLYAGSGALGIEALSRGARRAVLVERDRAALACIKKNVDELGIAAECTVLGVPVERLSDERLSPFAPFDLVFCDPPWSDLAEALRALSQVARALAPEARVVLEHPRKAKPELERFCAYDERHWGDTGVTLFRRATLDDGPVSD